MARCPAHADKSPSLKITPGDRRLLLHCFAGCQVASILEAIDLKWSDIFDDDLGHGIQPSLRVSDRRWLASRYSLEFAIAAIGCADAAEGVKHSDKDRESIRRAHGRLKGLRDQYGEHEFKQIAATWASSEGA